ncbi:hypothetical protein HK407_08g12620 [Ordospora pajunii]|uniref:uncharacterized protein n=1 Tax=Ordospora pajunii TaxID=3039483 RepID=UPI002952915D|nr:uncharacterized protein HK407_08g12620 [Ordospora pajunii]KAH9411118.1 hypothetical protein HK407_08g12620 [Ordospora pajunii]
MRFLEFVVCFVAVCRGGEGDEARMSAKSSIEIEQGDALLNSISASNRLFSNLMKSKFSLNIS